MFTLPAAAIAAGLLLAPAFSGVDDGGVAYADHWSSAELGRHVFIFTGDNPSNIGTVTLPLATVVPQGKRPICIAMAQWTMPEYAFGYPIPEWPNTFFDQAAYDVAGNTVTIRWHTDWENLQPDSNYSINVLCAAR